MYGNRSVFAFTCEIYGNDSAWQYEPGPAPNTYWERGITQAFNPDPKDVESVVQRWLPVFTYMAERAIAEAYDVAVTQVSAERATAESGSSLKIDTTVENQGFYEETFNLTLLANSTIVQTATTTLANQSEEILTFTWNTAGFPLGNYTISAQAEAIPGETDLTDNLMINGNVQVRKAPSITILSPENRTYPVFQIPLDFTRDEPASWIGYSLDGADNVTIAGNTILWYLAEGRHNVVVYANDTFGIIGASGRVFFTVDTTPPNITVVTQAPIAGNVQPENEVSINATIIDETSGVNQAIIVYAFTNTSGTWIRFVPMRNLEGNIWNGSIPALPYLTNVTYSIVAEDKAGNVATTEELGYEYRYGVVPELSLVVVLPFLMTTVLFALAAKARKRRKEPCATCAPFTVIVRSRSRARTTLSSGSQDRQ